MMDRNTGIPTVTEIERTVEANGERLTAARAQLASARQTYERAVSQFVPEDQSITAVQRRAEADAALRAAEREVAAVAAAVRREAHGFQTALSGASQPALTAAEHAVVASRRSEVERDVATLDAIALAGRMRAALLTNDKPAMHLYSQLAGNRPSGLDTGRPGEGEALTGIAQLRQQMTEQLRDPALDAPRQQVQQALVQAGDVEREAGARRAQREADEAASRIHHLAGGRGTPVPIPSDEELKRRQLAAAPYAAAMTFGYPIPDGD